MHPHTLNRLAQYCAMLALSALVGCAYAWAF